MTQHTPGPWRMVSTDIRARWPWLVDSPHDGVVAEIHDIGQAAEANARLVAAAPDLLAALKDLVPWAVDLLPLRGQHAGLAQSIADARAAIDRAEGKTK